MNKSMLTALVLSMAISGYASAQMPAQYEKFTKPSEETLKAYGLWPSVASTDTADTPVAPAQASVDVTAAPADVSATPAAPLSFFQRVKNSTIEGFNKGFNTVKDTATSLFAKKAVAQGANVVQAANYDVESGSVFITKTPTVKERMIGFKDQALNLTKMAWAKASNFAKITFTRENANKASQPVIDFCKQEPATATAIAASAGLITFVGYKLITKFMPSKPVSQGIKPV